MMKKIIAVFFLVMISGCVSGQGVQYTPTSLATDPNKNEEHQPTETILPTQQAPANTITLQLEDEQVTPIPERIIRDATCDDSAIKGHILFIHVENNLDYLYIMDGNGCNFRLLMEDVSGSPAWSIDGNWAATGCEGGKAICILSTESILETCYSIEKKCNPKVEKKYLLPNFSNSVGIGQVSWSYDGKYLLVEAFFNQPKSYTFLLTSKDDGEWEIIIDGGTANSELSPTNDYFIFSDGYSIKGLPLNHVQLKYYANGENAIFSPDGKRITFISWLDVGNDESYAILEWDEKTKPLIRILYEPVEYGNGLDTKNFFITPSNYRVLSWSPDDKYLAFIASGKILRLDKETGEAVLLSANLDFGAYDKFQGLAWGP